MGTWLLDETNVAFSTSDLAPAAPRPHKISVKISPLSENGHQIWSVDLTGQCNIYGARLELEDENTPVFSGLVQTAQYCPDWRRGFDEILTETVFGAERIERTADGIIFSGSAGSLRFVAGAE
jgi:hypothetical protein